MLHFGVISEIDTTGCRARVQLDADDMVTDFLPIAQTATLTDKGYQMFDVNEHVAVLMDNEAETGVILCAVYNTDDRPAAPATGAGEISRVLRSNGTARVTARASRASGTAGLKTTGDITVESGAKVKILATGKIRIDAGGENLHTLLADINTHLKNHKHVVAGAATTILQPTDLATSIALGLRIDNILE